MGEQLRAGMYYSPMWPQLKTLIESRRDDSSRDALLASLLSQGKVSEQEAAILKTSVPVVSGLSNR